MKGLLLGVGAILIFIAVGLIENIKSDNDFINSIPAILFFVGLTIMIVGVKI